MAGRIPQSFIDELLARTDIVEVVDSRVRLKKAGKNYSACCPFHSEKTPSFTVSPHKQFYYCFGCGASGNAVGFVMEHDSQSFPEAVEALAQQVGLEVPTDSVQSEASKTAEDARQRCYQLLEQAADFYARQLREHPFKDTAVAYLKQRGLSGQVAKAYHLGVAPPGWDNLIQRFSTEGSLTDDVRNALLDAGLVIEKDSHQLYDRFRGRIMFPIRDVRGRVLGFGARTLGDDKPKYLNSPESLIFHKGNELYGLYECRRSRAPVHRILVTEGYMDVVALAQHGIHYGVATLGTATSKEHLQRLFKFVPEIYFCFDGDDAGRRAAEKAAEQALPFMEDGRQLRFLFLPEHEDPDSLIRQEGREAFERRMERQSLSLGDYLFRLHSEQVNEHSLEGKARLSHLMMRPLQQLPEGIFKQLMLDRLAERVGVSVEDLKAQPVVVTTARQDRMLKQDTGHSTEERLAGLSDSARSQQPSPVSVANESTTGQRLTATALQALWYKPECIQLAMTNLMVMPHLVKDLDVQELKALSQVGPELVMLCELYQGVDQLNLNNADEVIGYFLAVKPEYDAHLRCWRKALYELDLHGVKPTAKSETILAAEIQDVLNRYRRLRLQQTYDALQAKVRNGEVLTEAERRQFKEIPIQLKV